MKKTAQAALLLVALSAGGQPSQTPKGSICGNVQDENGLPASLVRITAVFRDNRSTGTYPDGITDAYGHYCVTNLPLGDYIMTARDEEKGYPIVAWPFYFPGAPESIGPKISLTALNPDAYSDFHIPYKAAFLQVRAKDARTGGRINATLHIRLTPTRSEKSVMTVGYVSKMTVLIPPYEEILLTVTTPGYKSWPGDPSNGMPLNLSQGERNTLKIALEPSTP